ncbi:hypothetical protein M3B46_13680 [Sphingobacterium daejeonense]|uniref:hypothetical protein n=1 Tax=Sphingobacterium daejeonense TaxID=371142 RepID=UPI0021A4896C|nr:hypothetical protein [Sphingobacterium daejeonense]MCT1532048.1 hypothetical protein [Sphingobacterium daejeonense]
MKSIIFIISIICLLLFSLKGYSQEESESRKGMFGLTYKYSFTDDNNTKEYVSNGHSILINRMFTVDKLVSVGPALDYTYLKGLDNPNNLSLGADVYLYPLHLISLLKEEGYMPTKDNYFMSMGWYKTINKSNLNSIFNVIFYVYSLPVGNKLKISPTIGASFYRRKEQQTEDFSFYNIGLSLRL